MKKFYDRLSVANVVSVIALFVALGGTGLAASQLGRNSVGTKQLRSNSVTHAKIRKNAVRTAKIRGGAVTRKKIRNKAVNGAKIANGSVTGEKINAATTPFSQVVARLRIPAITHIASNFGERKLGSYTQRAGEVDQFLGGFEASFAGTECGAPRKITAYLALDATGGPPPPASIIGAVFFEDTSGAQETRQLEFGPYPAVGAAMTRIAPSSDVNHNVSIWIEHASCGGHPDGLAGFGLGLGPAAVDVIGTRPG